MKDFFENLGIGILVYAVIIGLALFIGVLFSPISAIFQ